MIFKAIMIAVLGAGCDWVLRLDPVTLPVAEDAATVDTSVAECRDPAQITHDEDGDGVVDGCDNCPARTNPTQANEDDDEAGDVCDPQMSVAGDTIGLFDPFTTLLPSWKVYGGTWMLADDHVSQSAAGAIPGDLRYEIKFVDATVEVVFEDSIENGNPAAVGIYARVDEASGTGITDGIVCQLLWVNSSLSLDVTQVIAGSGTGHQMTGLSAGQPTVIRANQRGFCSARRGAQLPADVQLSPSSLPIPSDIMIHTDSATTTVTSVTVFERK